ncbi:MAG: CoA transferase, partial [Dehalococcoidales bacterium]|nr:CoA transferase [Dehalococcoidales bacterium]
MDPRVEKDYMKEIIVAEQALNGLTVLDFSSAGAGPLCSKYLADFGAEVIKLESATHPDLTRLIGPYKDNVADLNSSGLFISMNSSQCSVTVNMNHPLGVNLVKRLIEQVDIVLENFSPGQMGKWQLGYDDLKKIKEDIIMVSVSLMGQTGPLSDFSGFGFHAAAACGLYEMIGWPDREPVTTGIAYPDVTAAMFGVCATMAAVEYRRKYGKGQHIDLSLLESSIFCILPQIVDYAVNHQQQSRAGNRSNMAAPHGVYRCKGDDRWCAIAVSNEEEWIAFIKVIGNPD